MSTAFLLSARWVTFSGDLIALTFGVGDDHGRFDVYVNKTLWRSFDGYAGSSGEEAVYLALDDGDHTLEIRTTRYRNPDSSGNLLRFKQLQVLETTDDEHTIQYTYDALSRLLEADYDNGDTVYTYAFDVAGNLVDMDGASRTYNAANQLTNDGTNTLTYDANGNLTNDGVNAYTWDRANRLLTAPGSTSYQYDVLGNRIQQTVSSVITDYLLDLQPGLVKVLREDDGTNTSHFIHTPQGIHAQYDGTDWQYIARDGLGSVRSLISSPVGVDAVQSYDPFGNPLNSYGAGYGFTGEQTDGNGQVFLRKRYYNPGIGVFNSLDPFEGMTCTPMSLNGYGYVHGNPVMNIDPSGMTCVCEQYLPNDINAYRACIANRSLDSKRTKRGGSVLHPKNLL